MFEWLTNGLSNIWDEIKPAASNAVSSAASGQVGGGSWTDDLFHAGLGIAGNVVGDYMKGKQSDSDTVRELTAKALAEKFLNNGGGAAAGAVENQRKQMLLNAYQNYIQNQNNAQQEKVGAYNNLANLTSDLALRGGRSSVRSTQ